MPETFIFQRSDGSTVEIPADSFADALAKLKVRTPAEVTSDIGVGAKRGAALAGAGLVGMPGDIEAGAGWLAKTLQKVTPEQQAQAREQARQAALAAGKVEPPPGTIFPTSGEMMEQIERLTGPLQKPETPAGQYAQSIVAHAPGLAMPGGIARKVIGGVVAPGVISETARRLTEGSALEPYAATAGSVAGGFLGTRQFPAVGGRAGAMRTVSELYDPSDLSRLRELGPQSFTFEANPSLERVMSGVIQRPGPASTRATEEILTRQEKAPARLAKEYTAAAEKGAEDLLKAHPVPGLRASAWTSGEPVVPSEFLDNLKQQKRALGPQYDAVVQGAGAVDLTPAAQFVINRGPKLSGPPAHAVEKAVDVLFPIDQATGQRIVRTNAEEILNTRHALDDQLASMEKGTHAHRLITHVRDLVDKSLAAAVPDIKKIDRGYAHIAQQEKDFALGQTVLRTGGEEVIHPADLRAHISKIKGDTANDAITILGRNTSPDQIKQLADKMYVQRLGAIQAGIRSDLDRIAGTSIYDVTALKRAVQTQGDWNYEKLVDVFGKTAATRIIRATNREVEFGRAYNDMLRNSMTAQRQIAEKMTNIMESGTGPGMDVTTGLIVGALTGEPVSAMAAGAASAGLRTKLKQFVRSITAGGQRRLDDALADILLTKSLAGRGESALELIEALQRGKAAGPSWRRTLSGVGLAGEAGSAPYRIEPTRGSKSWVSGWINSLSSAP